MTVAIPKVTYGPPTVRIKQGATLPAFTYVTVDENQQVVPLVGATLVEFIYRLQSAAAATAVVRTAVIVSASTGEVRYDWVTEDTAVAGAYFAEWRVTFLDGKVRKFPIRGYLPFVVEAQLN